MQNQITRCLIFLMFSLSLSSVYAETNYVVDELKVGLHQSQSTDSPILVLIPSGAAVTILERDSDLVKVTESGGKTGWLHTRYLTETKPGRALTSQLQKENAQLKKDIELMRARLNADNANPETNNDSGNLEQQLNTERIKVGELQAQLAEIKANIPSMQNPDGLLQKIEQLKQANAALVNQMESAGMQIDSDNTHNDSTMTMKAQLIVATVLFIIGMLAGGFILDYFNRRRHGGFRV